LYIKIALLNGLMPYASTFEQIDKSIFAFAVIALTYTCIVGVHDKIYFYRLAFFGGKCHFPHFPVIAKTAYFTVISVLLFEQWQPFIFGFDFKPAQTV